MRTHVTTWALVVALGLAIAAPSWAAPPPWAPAHGYRRQQASVYRYPTRAYYEPIPFYYSGVTYLPLRDVTSILGAALLWDSLRGRALFTYDGRDFGLLLGSRTFYIDDRAFYLPVAPILVRNVVYVPVSFCQYHLRVPVRHHRGRISLQGPHGWRDFRVASRPPGRVSYGKAHVPPGQMREKARGHGKGPAVKSSKKKASVKATKPRGQGHSTHRMKGPGKAGKAPGKGPGAKGKSKGKGKGKGHGK